MYSNQKPRLMAPGDKMWDLSLIDNPQKEDLVAAIDQMVESLSTPEIEARCPKLEDWVNELKSIRAEIDRDGVEADTGDDIDTVMEEIYDLADEYDITILSLATT